MRAEHINPFIESVYELFRTMLQAKVERGAIGVSSGNHARRDITAIIGISGPTRGTVAIGFPAATAVGMVGRILGTTVHAVDETISDGVSEIVNMVAGSAKAKLKTASEKPLDLGLPTVVLGEKYDVQYPSKAVWLEVPFTSDFGEFNLRVTFETTPQ
ncbi:MAG TPA: chemotaxis protein CheX [Candidatus Hydrogenedentes bacterium]|nr:chemotaxis protein CheX [Candidatus Hydrogenedentota bacterium]HRK35071.1 chemotaxis protein CheX [Candidatus Hydrogenedentota bacterium]